MIVGLQELECFGSGDCPIDPGSRKCCPACRMRRCLAVGMNPQLLLRMHFYITHSSSKYTWFSVFAKKSLTFSDFNIFVSK